MLSATQPLQQKISDIEGNFDGMLNDGATFGTGVAELGDLDGDGVPDLAVGAEGGTGPGAVHVLFMNANGTVKDSQEIGDGTGGLPTGTLRNGDGFGGSVTALGDMDNDGVTELAVGAIFDDTGGNNRGAVYVLFMNANGTVKQDPDPKFQKIANGNGGLPSSTLNSSFPDQFGSVTALGDMDNDGVTELAVGALCDDTGGFCRGAVYVLFLNANGTIKPSKTTKIADGTGGLPAGTLSNDDNFGRRIAAVGDMDSDGVSELAVGAIRDNTGGPLRGAVYVLFLNAAGTIKQDPSPKFQKIADGTGGFPAGELDNVDLFGSSVGFLRDLDGDGVTELAVGARRDDTGGPERGALYVLFLNANGTIKGFQKIAHNEGGFAGGLDDGDQFGGSSAMLGDLNGDNTPELALGAFLDDDGGTNRGAVWIVSLACDGTVAFANQPPDTPVDSDLGANEVAEVAAFDTTVGITATANDHACDTLTYSLTDDAGGRFAIDSNIGVVSVANGASLNFETDTSHMITVQTEDSSGATSSESFTINVLDVNEAPTVDPATFNVDENSPNTTSVGTATASDQDAGDSLTFSITAGNTFSAFAINGTTGEIIVNNSAAIDFETTPTFTLTVHAEDTGTLIGAATITISLNDIDPVGDTTAAIDDVQELKNSGVLSDGEANPTLNHFDQAIKDLNKGKTSHAVQKLEQARDRIQDQIDHGDLTPAQGEPLIDTIDDMIDEILSGSALRASAASDVGPWPTAMLTDEALQPIVRRAVAHLDRTTGQGDALRHISLEVRDLPRDFLGFASPRVIWIDADAAGYGWSLNGLGGMDLFSAVTHELGHVLGHDHDHRSGVMAPTLGAGQRPAQAVVLNSLLMSAYPSINGIDAGLLSPLSSVHSASNRAELMESLDSGSGGWSGLEPDASLASPSLPQLIAAKGMTGYLADAKLLGILDERLPDDDLEDDKADGDEAVDYVLSAWAKTSEA